jgi:hypothetical protein
VGSSSASSSCSTTSGEEEQQKEKALRHRDGRGGNGAGYRKLPLQCSVDTMDEETQENAHSTTEHFTDTMNNQDVRSTCHVHKLDEFVFLHVQADKCSPRPVSQVSKCSLQASGRDPSVGSQYVSRPLTTQNGTFRAWLSSGSS